VIKKYLILLLSLIFFCPLFAQDITTPNPVPTHNVYIKGLWESRHKMPVSSLDRIKIVFQPGVTSEQKNKLLWPIGYYQFTDSVNLDLNSYEVWIANGMSLDDNLKKLKDNPLVKAVILEKAGPLGDSSMIVTPTSIPTLFVSTQTVTQVEAFPSPDSDGRVPGKDYVADEVLVSINDGPTDDEEDILMQRLIFGIGLFERAHHNRSSYNWYQIKITNGMSVEDVVNKFKKNPRVKYAETNNIMHLNDMGFD
jgi:hypothetical protein